MAGFAGSILYVAWVHPSGTLTLANGTATSNVKFRSFNMNESQEFIDSTGGADSYRQRIPSFGDTSASFSGIYQSGGSAAITPLAKATSGTLLVGVEGTAVGKPKKTIPAYSMGVSWSVPYNDIVDFSVSWQGNGAATDATW